MTVYSIEDLSLLAEIDSELVRIFAQLDASDYAEETKAILRVIGEVGSSLRTFSANDVRPRLPEVKTARIGRAFSMAADLGWIEFVGTIRSNDRGTHGKRLNRWRWLS